MKTLKKRNSTPNTSLSDTGVIFFGLGSIGLRHFHLLKNNPKFKFKYYAFRSGRGVGTTPEGVTELSTWEQVDEIRPKVAFICNPTSFHISTALKCARQNMHLFIEKPVGHSTVGLKNLLSEVKKKKVTAYVAYNLRFHPGILRLKQLLEHETGKGHVRSVVSTNLAEWRPGVDHKKSYSAQRKMGGGIILDISHEFDLARFLFGPIKNIKGISGKLSGVTVDSEDFTDAVFQAGNYLVNLHMNLYSVHPVRRLEIDIPGKYIEFDLLTSTLTVQTSKDSKTESFSVEKNQTYENQLNYFFENIDNPALMNNLGEASPLFLEIIKFRERSYL